MRKIILSIFVLFVTIVLITKTTILKADAIVTLTDGASIRLDSPTGLRFQATVSKPVISAKYGIAYFDGIVEKEKMKVGIDGIKNIEVDELKDDNSYTISIVPISTYAYFSSITARAYIYIDGDYIYSDNIVTRNINEVARMWKKNYQENENIYINEMLSISKLNTDGGTIRYQNHRAMVKDFLKDFNEYSGSVFVTADALYSASNAYEAFFDNEEMFKKWSWILEFLIDLTEQGYCNDSSAIIQYKKLLNKEVVDTMLPIAQALQGIMTLSFCSLYNTNSAIDFSLYEVSSQIQGAINGGEEYVNTSYLPTPYRTGYTFKGWYDEDDNLVTSFIEGIELTAKWEVIGVHSHLYDKETILPSCTNKGYDLYICKICGDEYIDNEIEMLHHSNILLSDDGPIDCLHNGTKIYQCENCLLLSYENYKGECKWSLKNILVDEVNQCGEFECEVCHNNKKDNISSSDLNMPVLNINGSMEGISKENKIIVSINYEFQNININSKATIKWQGSSSIVYPKKNYNINLINDNGKKNKVIINDEWGKQSKYTLKANYIDYSQSRNVVSAQIFGQIVHSRDLNDNYNDLINGGAIDGFPIVIFINGAYQGLYTLNIPKDKWLFEMGDGEKEAILMGDNWTSSAYLKENITDDFSNGWELEYCSTEDTSWVVNSFNDFVFFLNNASDDDFIANINNYTSLERVIDCLIFTNVMMAYDNVAKNILWTTYDGIKWVPTLYDMDSTYGLHYTGDSFINFDYRGLLLGNLLYERIFRCFFSEISNRFYELNETILSISNIESVFLTFNNKINPIIWKTEMLKWKDVPSTEENNIKQIITFLLNRIEYLIKIAFNI